MAISALVLRMATRFESLRRIRARVLAQNRVSHDECEGPPRFGVGAAVQIGTENAAQLVNRWFRLQKPQIDNNTVPPRLIAALAVHAAEGTT
jgi:hypothetical protein